MERIIADRLIYILETRKLLNPNQACFRQGRCTTDQIIKLVQDATDNNQEPRHESHRGIDEDVQRKTYVEYQDHQNHSGERQKSASSQCSLMERRQPQGGTAG